jgi:hypothetical protein
MIKHRLQAANMRRKSDGVHRAYIHFERASPAHRDVQGIFQNMLGRKSEEPIS